MSDFVPGRIPARLSSLATLKLSCPADHVLLVTLNRPKALNVFNAEMEEEMGRVLQWADDDEYMWYVALTPYYLFEVWTHLRAVDVGSLS